MGTTKRSSSSISGSRDSKSKARYETLSMEDYDMFFNNPHTDTDTDTRTSALNYEKLSQIVHMHGYYKLSRQDRRRALFVEAVSGIDKLMSPNRSTLKEEATTQISSANNAASLSFDQLNADLDSLHWRDMSLQTFQYLSFNHHDDDDSHNSNMLNTTTTDADGSKTKRGRKPKGKERKVFDPVYVTKPRSRSRIQKRKCLSSLVLSASFPFP